MLNLLKPPAVVLSPQMFPPAQVSALYIHVPFCFHKCHYCDFYSITRQTPQRMENFVDLLLTEADLWLGDGVHPSADIRTLFIGGGTPSLLPLPEMHRLLRGITGRFDLSNLDEWTIEANPATVTAEYCQMLRESGVNRLSFGAQSFDVDELKTLERHHEPDDVHRSVELARSAGFDRLNLDLIFAIPGQDLASWRRSLDIALQIGTTHLSCYALTYEPNTPITVRKRMGQFQSAPEDLEIQMLHETRDRLLDLGIPAYEISNFARPGQECRHNLNYWTGGNYIGLGPSAASHVAGWRWKNRPHLGEWESAVRMGSLPTTEVETLTPRQRVGEMAMLMLRLRSGIDLKTCTEKTGIDAESEFASVINQLKGVGLIRVTDDHVQLTRKGIAIADAVAGEFLE